MIFVLLSPIDCVKRRVDNQHRFFENVNMQQTDMD
jgi:hypothetical protein